MPTIPTNLRTSTEWGAVAVVFDRFPDDYRIWEYVDITRRRIDFDAMLSNQTFATSEALMLRAAASLWRGEGHELSLGRMANAVDNETLRVVLRALAIYAKAPITWDGQPV